MDELITSSEGGTPDSIIEGAIVTGVTLAVLLFQNLIFIYQKSNPPCSSLISLAFSIPSFLNRFTTNSFVNNPSLGKMTNKEGIDKAQTHILEGLHWMNEVSLHNKARVVATAAREMKFDKLSDCMDKLRSSYQFLEREKKKLI
ncbi:unnamed protein product [Lactuca virosa]|uniref:Uncharacterized protein n=1 Tax=Lactuca virosa TaxID=75947 RepID=A0AAU9NRQ8_9ASTR|nr:unnamed protein product [Lactuca virosa]